MICPNCGRETPDGMSFCFNCGAKLVAQSQAEQAQQAAAQAQAQAQREAEEAAARAQREAQEAQARAQREAQEAAERAQREAQEAAQRAQAQQAAAQQQYQQYGPQPQAPQYQQPQYQQPQYQQPQYQQPQYQQPQQPKAPKQPSAFDKLFTEEDSTLLCFYKKYYNPLLAVCSLISIAFTGVVFGLLFGSTGLVLTLLFLAAMTLGAAVVAQIFVAKGKPLGWILTLAAGGARWLTILVTMIGIFAEVRKHTPTILWNVFYSICALLIVGALIAGSVFVMIKNSKK